MGSSPIVPTKPSIAHLLLWTVFALFALPAPLYLALARPLPSSSLFSPPSPLSSPSSPLPSPPSPQFSLSSSFASPASSPLFLLPSPLVPPAPPCSACLRPLFRLPSPLVPSAFAPCSALVLFGVLFVAIYRDAPHSSPSPPPSAQFSATFLSSSYTLTGKNRNFAFVILSLVQESLLLSSGLSMTLKPSTRKTR